MFKQMRAFMCMVLLLGVPVFAGQKKQCPVKQPTPPAPVTNPTTVDTHSESLSKSSATGIGVGGDSRATATANPTANATGGAGGAGGQATGGTANQKQTQTATTGASTATTGPSTATQSGSNNTSLNYREVRQVQSAIAPDSFPSAPCIKGYGGALQTGVFGAGLGGGKVDKGCDDRETARSFALLGNRLAAAKILCGTNAAKRAHLTLEDCLAQEPRPVEPPAAITPPPVVETQNPPVTAPPSPEPPIRDLAPVPPVVPNKPVHRLLGICSFPSGKICSPLGEDAPKVDVNHVGSVCRTMLAAAKDELKENPEATLEVIGSEARVKNAKAYLLEKGVESERVKTTNKVDSKRTVEIWLTF